MRIVDRHARGEIAARFVARARSDVVAEELDGELVLLDEQTARLHVLNPTAALVWQCLDGEADVGTLSAEIAEELGADRAIVEHDVLLLVWQLAADGLIEQESSREGPAHVVSDGTSLRP